MELSVTKGGEGLRLNTGKYRISQWKIDSLGHASHELCHRATFPALAILLQLTLVYTELVVLQCLSAERWDCSAIMSNLHVFFFPFCFQFDEFVFSLFIFVFLERVSL